MPKELEIAKYNSAGRGETHSESFDSRCIFRRNRETLLRDNFRSEQRRLVIFLRTTRYKMKDGEFAWNSPSVVNMYQDIRLLYVANFISLDISYYKIRVTWQSNRFMTK